MGVLIDGTYYPEGRAKPSKGHAPTVARQNSVYQKTAEYQRFDMELVQPYLPNGQPNPEFIKFYPKEAVEYGFIGKDEHEKNI